MISKFAKKQTRFTANRIFTDRVQPSKVFADSILSIPTKPQEVIVYYGKGGIGKTRLLQQLCQSSEETYAAFSQYRFYNLFLSFDAREISNELGVMMSLRNKLHGDGGLFDYAVITYWAKAKFTINEIKNKNTLLSQNVLRILEEVVNLGNSSMSIPAFIVSEAEGLVKDEQIKREYAEEIQEMSLLTHAEIFERLPYYLGVCFSRAAEKGDMHVFFFDSYEHIRSVSQTRDWFMEFLASCETLRACIASRDKLKWGLENEGWDNVLNQHLLNNLSDEDSRWFLRQVPINDEDIIDKIVLHSGGVPLFLDMSVDLYQDDMNNGRTPDFSKIRQGEKLIDRYMNYMDENSAYAIKVLSIPDKFDTEYARYLLNKQGVRLNEEQLHNLFEKSIVLSIDEELGAWKIDESVRMHLREQTSEGRIGKILADMLSYVKEKGDGSVFSYFSSILNTVGKIPGSLANITESVAEQVDYYGNSGFWMELNSILEKYVDCADDNLKAIAVMAKIIYIRRTGSLKEEEAFICANPIDEERLGGYCFMYRYYAIQCRHLQGYYDEALERYSQLLNTMNLIKHMVPTHVYHTVCMKYADLLFLKGEFDRALVITEDLLGSPSLTIVDQIELMRIKGHIFKFRQKFEEAYTIYFTALKIVREKHLDACLGKLYTNLAEASAFIRPLEALDWFEEARLIHEKSGNLIELGKTYAACAIANANLGREKMQDKTAADKYLYDALSLANQAISFAKQAGYRSGEAFGLVGLALAYKYGENEKEYLLAKQRLETLLDELNVYKYLLDLVG